MQICTNYINRIEIAPGCRDLVSPREFLGEAHRLSQRNCKQIGLPRSLAYIAAGGYVGDDSRNADAVTILVSLSGIVGECRWVSRGRFVRGWRRWKIRFRCG